MSKEAPPRQKRHFLPEIEKEKKCDNGWGGLTGSTSFQEKLRKGKCPAIRGKKRKVSQIPQRKELSE